MLTVLQAILCVLRNLAMSILAVIIMAFNAIVQALGTLLAGLLAILPPFPDLPTLPTFVTDVIGWVGWFFPVGTVVAILAWFLTIWLIWQGVALALRWGKAL